MKAAARCLFVLVLLSPAPVYAQIVSFKNVVVIFQENRTPDNLFQGLCTTRLACSITPTGKQYNIQTSNWLDKTSPTGATQPLSIPLANTYDLGHAHWVWVKQCDKNAAGNCVMDGAANCAPGAGTTCPSQPQFRYAVGDPTAPKPYTLQPYLNLATQYGWANYMFQTNQGPSFPAHQFIFGATSAPSAADDAMGIFASNNMSGTGGGAGCIADPGVLVRLIDSSGSETKLSPIFPCFEHSTISDLLEARTPQVTWRYYAPNARGIWTAPNAINHICGPSGTSCIGTDWKNNVDTRNPSDVLTDITNCKLKQVTWVIPIGQNSDHAGGNTGGGPAWVASIVNAIGNSWTKSGNKCDYWGANSRGNETAIFITWDDWGGWYDHEPPAILASPEGGYQYGFRVPLIAVSAYTPVRVVDNHRHDFGSILRFIEQNYGIANVGFADARCDPSWANKCASDNLRAFFNYSHTPRTFKTIPANPGAEYFINDKTPPTDPDDD